jgi:hypothetical protein
MNNQRNALLLLLIIALAAFLRLWNLDSTSLVTMLPWSAIWVPRSWIPVCSRPMV